MAAPRIFQTTPLQEHLPRFEETLQRAVELYDSHDFDRCALAVEDLADKLASFADAACRASMMTIARFMVEAVSEDGRTAQTDAESTAGA